MGKGRVLYPGIRTRYMRIAHKEAKHTKKKANTNFYLTAPPPPPHDQLERGQNADVRACVSIIFRDFQSIEMLTKLIVFEFLIDTVPCA